MTGGTLERPATIVALTSLRDTAFDRWLDSALRDLPGAGTDLAATLEWAVAVGRDSHQHLGARSARRWELLASLAAQDVEAARALEPHLDALEILRQAGSIDLAPIEAGGDASWGVFAAEGPGLRVDASQGNDGWTLNGTKPWCSLARSLSHALVTAFTGVGTRRLFAVDLRGSGVDAAEGPWVARGLPRIVSAPVSFDRARAVPVGGDDWYLRRPGFAWGAIGVAACWWGGAIGIARSLFGRAAQREPDQIALMHLGAVDAALTAARAVLLEAAGADDLEEPVEDPHIIARRVRCVVVGTVEEVVARAGHALGPGPMTTDESYAARVADLQLYIRQHHAERDDAALGQALLSLGRAPW